MVGGAYAGNLRLVLDRFRDHLERSGLVPPGVGIVVGWSGGADSTALLLLLRDAGREPVAAHLDHAQRDGSDEEAERLGRVADDWGIAFAKGRADVPAIARVRRIGLEEAGREARYSFLESVRRATGAEIVATGHTRTDQAETVLFRLARGSGIGGLGGIPERRARIVRPLLPFSREETEAFCRSRGWDPLRDSANEDRRHARARIRSEVMPALRAINAGAEAALARLAARAREEDAFLDAAAAAGLERAERPGHPLLGFVAASAELRFDRSALLHLPPVLLRRAFRLASGALGGRLDEIHVLTLEASVRAGAGAGVTAAGGRVTGSVEGNDVVFRDLLAPIPARYPLAPGTLESDEFGWRMKLSLRPPCVAEGLAAELDPAAIRGGLHVRTAEAGDLLVLGEGQKVRRALDLMKAAGLPSAIRRRLPVVADLVGPLWIPGVATAWRAVPSRGSVQVVRLDFGPLAGDEERDESPLSLGASQQGSG